MRFETLGYIGQVGVLVLLALSFRPWETPKGRSCKEENAIIDEWAGMNVIQDVRTNGRNIDIFVHDQKWESLPRSTQVEIGKAAYCQITLAEQNSLEKNGIVRIDDLKGKELARVSEGKWSSWKFPE